MEIDIKMMTEEAYRTLKKNYEEVYKMICDHPSDSSWLKDYLGFEPYEVKKYVIDDFELKIADDYKTVEFDNDIKLYETLNKLPKYILCNIRFWAWITFEKAYKQAIAAIPFKSSAIVKNWWLPGNSRRDLMLGTGNALVTECYNTCFVLEENNQYLLVDGGGGNGILHQLKHAGINWKNIKSIFVTHKHLDHITGIIWMIRMICQHMKQGEYDGDATIYAHEEAITLLIDISQKLLQKKDVEFINKRLHFKVV